MKPHLKIFDSAETLAKELVREFILSIPKILVKKQNASLVLSGGSTPTLFYSELAKVSGQFNHWDKILFFWGDE
ncbi:MAG: 6-phosphogluconolactonase, partial [bacterium]